MADKKSKAEVATATWLADTTVSGVSPWKTFTQPEDLDSEKEYFCVATWGILSLTAAPSFMRNSPGNNNMDENKCIGVSMSVKTSGWTSCIAETLTVWHERKFSSEFYRTDAHRKGMEALRGRVEFRSHKVWVKASDLPRHGDTEGLKKLWCAVKRGEYRSLKD